MGGKEYPGKGKNRLGERSPEMERIFLKGGRPKEKPEGDVHAAVLGNLLEGTRRKNPTRGLQMWSLITEEVYRRKKKEDY